MSFSRWHRPPDVEDDILPGFSGATDYIGSEDWRCVEKTPLSLGHPTLMVLYMF